MSKETVITIFKPFVRENEYLEIGDGQTVSIGFFVSLFSDVDDTPSYEELMESDGGVKGYADFFTRCRDEGLLS